MVKVVYRDNRGKESTFDSTVENLDRIYYSKDERFGEIGVDGSVLSSFIEGLKVNGNIRRHDGSYNSNGNDETTP